MKRDAIPPRLQLPKAGISSDKGAFSLTSPNPNRIRRASVLPGHGRTTGIDMPVHTKGQAMLRRMRPVERLTHKESSGRRC